MVEARGLTKSFGVRALWKELSFDLSRGQMLALTGPSGSGKSTLLNCLGVLESVDDGEILVNGQDITRFGRHQARRFRRDILGYLFQNYALIENATIAQNLDVALAAIRPWWRRPDYNEALERVGLGGRGKEMVFRLSGGEQQRVALARLIVKQPSLVLADEPTGALDEENGRVVVSALREMAQAGCAVVVATHNKDVVAACDDLLSVGT
ncbi:ABC transporter ATP-binding protein [Acrocarpospora macrocephala]|uniref:ABC transporter ATP-binding protein n=1 Tax=Acrocarpospora macrocephala TaxID=150177 RepID=UPI0012D2FBAA|nr:ABC transporter ATP-binding protein [Acrocarpospora macrocephala]